MARRFAIAWSLVVLIVLVSSGPVPTSQQALGRKARIQDAATPGVLGPLRTEALQPFTIDAAGIAPPPSDHLILDPATGAYYRRGEVLVRFKAGADAAVRAQALRRGGGARIIRALAGNWSVVELEQNGIAVDAVRMLRSSTAVEDVSLNYVLTPQQVRPNDENYSLQWNFDAINLPRAWELNPGASNEIIVAVIDSGLNTLNETFVFSSPIVGDIPVRFSAVPDLVAEGRIEGAHDFVYDDEFPVDLGGHGTHVAGTIAQLTNNNIGVAGIAYNVKLMPLKVISGGSLISWDDIFFPGNPGGSVAIVAEAIRYAADNNAKVINLSLGGPGAAPALREAIAYAVGRGVFVAIAAGNSAAAGNPAFYPAAYGGEIAGAMTVGAVNRDLRRASYSGFHPYVEICAPGGEVQSDVDYERGITQVGYEELSTLSFLSVTQKIAALRAGFRPRFDRFELRPFDGTSMATPHVAGVAALLYSQGIRNPAAIEQAIKRFATPIDARSDECGAGLVDPRRALRGMGIGR